MRSRSEHELLLQEAVGYFKSRQGLHRLLLQIKKKFQSLNAFGGTIKLAKLSELEKEHLGLFLNRSFKTQESLTIAVSKIEKQLQETRFAEVELKAILEAYFGEELLGNKIVEQSYHLEREHNITNWLLAQPETSIKKWLSEQFKVDSTWRRWIFQKYRENQQACFDQLTILAKSLNHLVENHFKPKKIAQFAAEMTGNPHYFDVGTEGEKLLTISLNRLVDSPIQTHYAEGRNELYFKFGLLRDTLSNYTFCYQVDAFLKEGQRHPGIAGYNSIGEPQIVSLESISQLEKVSCQQSRVFVSENPTIFHNLIKDLTNQSQISLMCTNGQLTIASLLMLDLVVQSGATIYYGGDFDPEGLRIAERLKNRYGKQLVFWRYAPEDYKAALSHEVLSANQLKNLNGLKNSDLELLANFIRVKERAGYQEVIYSRYLHDIETWAFQSERSD